MILTLLVLIFGGILCFIFLSDQIQNIYNSGWLDSQKSIQSSLEKNGYISYLKTDGNTEIVFTATGFLNSADFNNVKSLGANEFVNYLQKVGYYEYNDLSGNKRFLVTDTYLSNYNVTAKQ